MPQISVIMSVLNEEKYLVESIESILNQTFSDFEFIIIDDGSKDSTAEIIKRYAAKDSRITCIHHAKPKGLAVSLNEGIKVSKGEYIARMDGDDVSLRTRFEKQINFLQKHKDYGLAGTFYNDIDEHGMQLARKQNPEKWDDIKKAMFFYNPIAHPTSMIRKSVFNEVGLYNETFQTSQDYELFSRIFRKYKMYNVPEYLLIRRFPEEIFSTKKMIQQDMDSMRVRLKLLKDGVCPKYYYLFIIKYIIAFFIPVRIREKIRRVRHRGK
ncbi:glycosyltransferase family 2 protein [bacterium]